MSGGGPGRRAHLRYLRAARSRRAPLRTVEEKLEHVAAGRGIIVLPLSATLYYSRPDIVYVPVLDAEPDEVLLAYEHKTAIILASPTPPAAPLRPPAGYRHLHDPRTNRDRRGGLHARQRGPGIAADPIQGTDLADFLVGMAGPDTIDAKGGDDVVYGLGGADHIEGGDGDDTLIGDGVCKPGALVPDDCNESDDRSGGPDVLIGGNGDNQLRGGRGNDTITAETTPTRSPATPATTRSTAAGDDEIDGGTGLDKIKGGAGDDWIATGGGSDTIDAGSGNDIVATNPATITSSAARAGTRSTPAPATTRSTSATTNATPSTADPGTTR